MMWRNSTLLASASILASCQTYDGTTEIDGCSTRLPEGVAIREMTITPDFSGHRELRQEMGLQWPDGETQIGIYGVHAHHEGIWFSLIATQRGFGRWELSYVRKQQMFMPPPPPGAPAYEPSYSSYSGSFTMAESEKLERVLKRKCLSKEPTALDDESLAAGGWYYTIESRGDVATLAYSRVGPDAVKTPLRALTSHLFDVADRLHPDR